MRKVFFAIFFTAVFGMSTLANAILINNGGGLIYDSGQNITWYDYTYVSSDWKDATNWAAGLTAGGAGGWRLPSTVDGILNWQFDGTGTSGYNITSSEMGHLFYTELGNIGDGNTLSQNKGPFTNLQLGDDFTPALYWSSTEFKFKKLTDGTWIAVQNPTGAWAFSTTYGYQEPNDKANPDFYAFAVHEGNVGVPEPMTMLLLGVGLIGVAGAGRKFKK